MGLLMYDEGKGKGGDGNAGKDGDEPNTSNTSTAGPSNTNTNSLNTAGTAPPAAADSTTRRNALSNSEFEPTIPWERLHALRNRLVDRMQRLEQDGILDRSSSGEAEETAVSGGRGGVRSRAYASMFDFPPPMANQPAGTGLHPTVRSWAISHSERVNRIRDLHGGNNTTRNAGGSNSDSEVQQEGGSGSGGGGGEGGGTGGRRGDVASARRRAIADYGNEPLLSLDEYLRETRESSLNQNLERQLLASLSLGGGIDGVGGGASSSSTSSSSRAGPPLDPHLERIWNEYSSGPRRTEGNGSGSGTNGAGWTGQLGNAGQVVGGAHNQETFETFISHIRRIGHLQDAMLATIRSSANAALADTAAAVTAGNASAPAAGGGTSTSAIVDARAAMAAAAAATVPSTIPGGTAEARLRIMQTRIDMLASEFSLLRSTWGLTQADNRSLERSLRGLPGRGMGGGSALGQRMRIRRAEQTFGTAEAEDLLAAAANARYGEREGDGLGVGSGSGSGSGDAGRGGSGTGGGSNQMESLDYETMAIDALADPPERGGGGSGGSGSGSGSSGSTTAGTRRVTRRRYAGNVVDFWRGAGYNHYREWSERNPIASSVAVAMAAGAGTGAEVGRQGRGGAEWRSRGEAWEIDPPPPLLQRTTQQVVSEGQAPPERTEEEVERDKRKGLLTRMMDEFAVREMR